MFELFSGKDNVDRFLLSLLTSSVVQTCKDKAQADCWFLGLRSIISRNHHPRPLTSLKDHRGIVSCANSPAGFIRRKYNLGLLEDSTDFLQVLVTRVYSSLL